MNTPSRYHLEWLRQAYNRDEPLKSLFFWGHTNKYMEVWDALPAENR